VTDRAVTAQGEFREFATARAGHLFRLAYLMCGDWHEAEDLVQTTLARLYVNWHRVRRTDDPDGYARKALVNAFVSARRLRRAGERPVAEPPQAAAAAVDADLRLTLLAALRQLPPRSRAVVVLRHMDDLSIESVAELIGASPAAVKSLNARGLARLRELLTPEQSLFQP
jgi:RNA polymerase sigma-70 factor (sigma-E family)